PTEEALWMGAPPPARAPLLGTLAGEPARRYVTINYGPWDRLAGNEPFLPGVGPKPPGSGFYPPDITEDELLTAADAYPDEDLTGLYTLARRAGDRPVGVPYHEASAEPPAPAARAPPAPPA